MGVKGMPGVDPQTTGQHQPTAHQAKGDPWPWSQPQRDDSVSHGEREAVDRAAYDRFMRALG